MVNVLKQAICNARRVLFPTKKVRVAFVYVGEESTFIVQWELLNKHMQKGENIALNGHVWKVVRI